jgi:hypothetical protein
MSRTVVIPTEKLAEFDHLPDDAHVSEPIAAAVWGVSPDTYRREQPVPRRQLSKRRFGVRVGDLRNLIEKDCDNLRDLGLIATTCPGGAGKWKLEYSEFLRADILIICDNDQTGRDHADQVAGSLVGIAKRVRVLDLAKHWPECPEGGDVSDWLEAGGAVDQLISWIAAAQNGNQHRQHRRRRWNMIGHSRKNYPAN